MAKQNMVSILNQNTRHEPFSAVQDTNTFQTDKKPLDKGSLNLRKGTLQDSIKKAAQTGDWNDVKSFTPGVNWAKILQTPATEARDTVAMRPAVITSRRAKRDLGDIKAKHADIVMGFQNQAMKVDMLNQQKNAEASAEKANSDVLRSQEEQTRMTTDTDMKKTMMQNDLKKQELEIKKAALFSV